MHKITIIIGFVIISVTLIFYFLLDNNSFGDNQIEASKEINFEIKKGEGIKEISQRLKEKNLISSEISFYVYLFLKNKTDKLQAGKYLLNRKMRVGEMVNKFVAGDIVSSEVEFIIIPGWTIKEIANSFKNQGLFENQDIKEFFSKNQQFNYEFLSDKPKNFGYEGYLYPDTYRIFKDDKVETALQKILDNFNKKLTSDLREEIKKRGKTIFEIITMASILEKEVKTFDDKKIVAGIFWKRIKNGVPLQADATLTYILGKTSQQLTLDDLKNKSPYNTYLNLGLPYGPISNPSLDSIKAAIYYEESQFWYYLSNKEGITIFSKTFEEHKKAKVKYLYKP